MFIYLLVSLGGTMAAGRLLTLAALAGLAMAPMEARAETNPKAVAAAKATTVDTARDGKKIKRSHVALSTGYSTLKLNGKEHETGYYLGARGSANFQVSKWLNLKADLNSYHTSMGFKTMNATELDSKLSLSLEGRVRLCSSKNLRVLMGLGAGYEMKNDVITLDGEKARQMINAAGPEMSLGIESRYVDFYMTGSVLFGPKSSTFDIGRDIIMQKASITLVPRYWRLDIPMTAEFYHWAINDSIVDKHNFYMTFAMQPGIRVANNLRLFLDVRYNHLDGDDTTGTMQIGVGLEGDIK